MSQERIAFESWLGIKPCGAAHDLAWAAWQARASLPAPPQQATPDHFPDAGKMIATPEPVGVDIKAAAGRLMGWKLPPDFSPDNGIRFSPPSFGWPTGTNLLNVAQAEQMLAYALEGCTRPAAAPAVPEVEVPKWCWWLGDGERFQIVDTEAEAHGEAQCSIDDDCDPGQTHQYSVARVQHPLDALGMDWLALHVAESIAENVCCWCDDNTGAEEPSIMLSPDDSKALGLMVATFLRQRVGVDWWTADQKTVTVHTYVAGSNDSAMLAAAQAKGGDHG